MKPTRLLHAESPAASLPESARARSRRLAFVALLALLVLSVGWDAFRIGFFADDFLYLDVARRVPLLSALSGQYGVWPYVRPLSRELYFRVVTAGGPAAGIVAHVLALACLFGCAWWLWRLGRRLLTPAAAAIAVALFLSYDFTKFLAAWASGFQDLLALLLVLVALETHLEGRRGISLAAAALAPFAKETSLIVFPLLVACVVLVQRQRPARAWLARLGSIAGAVLLLHLLARLTWHSAGPTSRATLQAERLPAELGRVFGAFLATGPPPGAGAVAATLALLAGVAAAVLCYSAGPSLAGTDDHLRGVARPRTVLFVALAAGLGLVPAATGHLSYVSLAHAYHFFPAVPWIALLLGLALERLPARSWGVVVPLLVAWNAWGLGYVAPRLDLTESWTFRRWDWREAVRLSAISRSLADDVRGLFASRPDSLVVLYEYMPTGSFFQTQDGPATREALDDPGVRAYWANDPARHLRPDRLAILNFDAVTPHLRREQWSAETAIHRATRAIVARRGPAASAFALHGDPPDAARFDRAYLCAAAALLDDGPAAFARMLPVAGVPDTLVAEVARLAEPTAGAAPGLAAAFTRMLHHPLDAASHLVLADTLLARRQIERAALELRVAVTLEPARMWDRLRLARLMLAMGGTTEALEDLREIAASPNAGPAVGVARDAIRQITRQLSPAPATPPGP